MREIYVNRNDLICVNEPIRHTSLNSDSSIYVFDKRKFGIGFVLDMKGLSMFERLLNFSGSVSFSSVRDISDKISKEKLNLKELQLMLNKSSENYLVLDGMHRVISSVYGVNAKEIETEDDLEELSQYAPVEELVLHVHLLNFYYYANRKGLRTFK